MDERALRSKVIRLAKEHPEFRSDLLPLVAKEAAPIPLPVQRETVRGWIEAQGLVSLGTRAGKGGEFYGRNSISPTRVISLGNRDLLLNTYTIGKRRGDTKFDERWSLFRAELLSKTTEEMVRRWAEWVKLGPDRRELRNKTNEELANSTQDYVYNSGETKTLPPGHDRLASGNLVPGDVERGLGAALGHLKFAEREVVQLLRDANSNGVSGQMLRDVVKAIQDCRETMDETQRVLIDGDYDGVW